MKHIYRIKQRIREIIRKGYLDWPDWFRLMNEIEICFELEAMEDTEMPAARKDALTTLYNTLDEFGVNLDNYSLNMHYIEICKHTLYFL